jgi:hypothetical protein
MEWTRLRLLATWPTLVFFVTLLVLAACPLTAAYPGIDHPGAVTKNGPPPTATAKPTGFPWLIAGLGLVAIGVLVFLLLNRKPNYPFNTLEFPFANWQQITRMAAFGIPNWSGSEPHNGIDLVVSNPAVIVSPTAGTISAITISENQYSHPAGQMILNVNIYINSQRTVYLVFEPSTTSSATKAQQTAAITVKTGDTVAVGTVIGTLLVGELGYTHLHYWLEDAAQGPVCAYSYSSGAARTIFETLRNTRTNNSLPDGKICYGQ